MKTIRTWNRWRRDRAYIPLRNRAGLAAGICALMSWAGISSDTSWWFIAIACVPWLAAFLLGVADGWREWNRLGRPVSCRRGYFEHGHDENPATPCRGGE